MQTTCLPRYEYSADTSLSFLLAVTPRYSQCIQSGEGTFQITELLPLDGKASR